jgi:hypothetical protein
MLLVFFFPLFLTLRGLTTLTGFLPVFLLLVLFFTRATLTLLLVFILGGGLAIPLLGLAEAGRQLPGVQGQEIRI